MPGLIYNGSKTELWVLAPGESRRVAEFDSRFESIVGHNDDLLVLCEGNVSHPAGVLRVFANPDK